MFYPFHFLYWSSAVWEAEQWVPTQASCREVGSRVVVCMLVAESQPWREHLASSAPTAVLTEPSAAGLLAHPLPLACIWAGKLPSCFTIILSFDWHLLSELGCFVLVCFCLVQFQFSPQDILSTQSPGRFFLYMFHIISFSVLLSKQSNLNLLCLLMMFIFIFHLLIARTDIFTFKVHLLSLKKFVNKIRHLNSNEHLYASTF